MLVINSLSNMFTAVLLISGMYTAFTFNIHKTPVTHFTNEDQLFGQIIVQFKDGVVVPSPNSGDIFECDLVKNCSIRKVRKGSKPITSAASSLDTGKLLVCNQVQTRVASTENFNGHCTLLSNGENEEMSPASLVKESETNSNNVSEMLCPDLLKRDSTNNNNNNNNNNYYHGNSTGHQVHRRMRREEKSDEETNNNEDAGTEIAFVLDGSGSIEHDDFGRAKDFIYNVMLKVWTSCFSCNFAIVQYGTKIRTELSLLENNDGAKALDKVKNIKQAYNLTRTASALYHVLTEVFVPQNGSKPNSKKIIILLSDGEMMGDNKNLTDVLSMPQMKDVLRFAIGVGPQVVNKPKAVQQMIDIAGSEKQYFNVSNYAALENILSCLEQSIIAIEGIQKGAGFELQLAESGFSSHLTFDGSLLFGAVGAYDWSGGIILKKEKDKTVSFLKASQEEPRFSYLGYSVTSAHVGTKTLYISGAPRYNLTGAVFVFDGTSEDVVKGDQVGSYFGAVLCVLDIDADKEVDHLLVGAPHFHNRGEEGKVLVYKLHEGRFERAGELRGLGGYDYARFGSAIASIGDVDENNYCDVAVGAPLEAEDPTGSSGSIYIFNGFQGGIMQRHSQRISSSDLGMKLVHFGQAVSAMNSPDGKPFISVGSEKTVIVLKSIPVIDITPEIRLKPKTISLAQQTTDIYLQICFQSKKNQIIGSEKLLIEYQFDLDSGKEEKRLFCDGCQKRVSFTVDSSKTCTDSLTLNFVGCHDCFSPIRIKMNFTSISPSSGDPVRVLDMFTPNEVIEEIQFERECKDHCQSNISLADSKLSTKLVIIGRTQTLGITFNLTNTGDNSYWTTLILAYPEILLAKKIDGEGKQCEVKNDNLQIICKLSHPNFKRDAKMTVNVIWQPKTMKSDLRNATITASLTGGNSGNQKLDSKTYSFELKNDFAVQLKGKAVPQRLSITEDEMSTKKQELLLIWQLLGKNEFRAKINVIITIKKEAHNTDLEISDIKPKNCTQLFSNNSESTYHIECNLTDPQNITIKMDTHIHDIQFETKRKQDNNTILATAELSFDENIYEGTELMKETIEVKIYKITVVTSTVPIIAGATGGLIFLIILIIILIKCGFFKRRHKVERGESLH